MIKTETITVGTRKLTRTYSDAGMKIERDGVRYDEAVDPIDSGRTYIETDEPIDSDMGFSAEEALNIIVGGAT